MLHPVQLSSLDAPIDPATVIKFEQIEFLDITGCKLLIMARKNLSADALEFFRNAGKRGGKKGASQAGRPRQVR
jgi:hypothetical protein